MKKPVYFSALVFLMLITGVFWGTWFTLTRSLETFGPEEFIHIGKTIIANVAWPMRIIMPTGILLITWALWLCEEKKTNGFYAGLLSLVLLILVLLITLMVLVPLDNAIKEWTTAPADFEQIKLKWKSFHALRTYLCLGSFVCFSFFIITDRNKA